MASVGSLTTTKLMGILIGSGGIPDTVAAFAAQQNLSLPAITSQQIVAQNVPPEIAGRSKVTKYPAMYVYCSKITNLQREKFRTFSGDVIMVIESRVSQDRLDNLEGNSQFYVDALTTVLDSNQGDWGDGVCYGGGYEVSFGGVKQGGLNFIQISKVSFVLDVSAD